MWSVTNYFLLNLTMVDILMATLNCIFSFVYMRDRYIGLLDDINHFHGVHYYFSFRVWYFGSIFCSLTQFISLSTVPASVFTMLAITLDRRRAIMTPLAPKTSKLMAVVSLVIIWTLCTVMALPPTIYSSTLIINPQARQVETRNDPSPWSILEISQIFKIDYGPTTNNIINLVQPYINFCCRPSDHASVCIVIWPDGPQGYSQIDF